MADLKTKEDVLKKIAELQKLADQMTAPNQVACIKCGTLYVNANVARFNCFCDYESDWSFD